MEVGGERHSEATQPPEKEPRYPSQRRLGGRLMPSLERYGVGAAQPVTSGYTNYTIPAPKTQVVGEKPFPVPKFCQKSNLS